MLTLSRTRTLIKTVASLLTLTLPSTLTLYLTPTVTPNPSCDSQHLNPCRDGTLTRTTHACAQEYSFGDDTELLEVQGPCGDDVVTTEDDCGLVLPGKPGVRPLCRVRNGLGLGLARLGLGMGLGLGLGSGLQLPARATLSVVPPSSLRV